MIEHIERKIVATTAPKMRSLSQVSTLPTKSSDKQVEPKSSEA